MTSPTVLHGDCLDHLRAMPDASVSAIVTDPPYGLSDLKPAAVTAAILAWAAGDRERVPDARGFMGRNWDGFVPPPAVFDECLRVLKPGGHLLCFAGTRTVDLMGLSIRLAGFTIRDSITWHHGQGFPKGKAQLKPASEPILVARKAGPLWLNIDACRVGTSKNVPASASVPVTGEHGIYNAGWTAMEQRSGMDPNTGRWPANVVLSHGPECSGECQPGCPVAELDAQAPEVGGAPGARKNTAEAHNRTASMGGTSADWTSQGYSEPRGGASRFFPTFKYQAKAPTSERPKVDGKSHPTVKPLALIKFLVRLVTPPGGIVLDPFAGSGTTLEAAQLLGYDAIGIERDPDYLPLIQARIDRASAGTVQGDLFDLDAAS